MGKGKTGRKNEKTIIERAEEIAAGFEQEPSSSEPADVLVSDLEGEGEDLSEAVKTPEPQPFYVAAIDAKSSATALGIIKITPDTKITSIADFDPTYDLEGNIVREGLLIHESMFDNTGRLPRPGKEAKLPTHGGVSFLLTEEAERYKVGFSAQAEEINPGKGLVSLNDKTRTCLTAVVDRAVEKLRDYVVADGGEEALKRTFVVAANPRFDLEPESTSVEYNLLLGELTLAAITRYFKLTPDEAENAFEIIKELDALAYVVANGDFPIEDGTPVLVASQGGSFTESLILIDYERGTTFEFEEDEETGLPYLVHPKLAANRHTESVFNVLAGKSIDEKHEKKFNAVPMSTKLAVLGSYFHVAGERYELQELDPKEDYTGRLVSPELEPPEDSEHYKVGRKYGWVKTTRIQTLADNRPSDPKAERLETKLDLGTFRRDSNISRLITLQKNEDGAAVIGANWKIYSDTVAKARIDDIKTIYGRLGGKPDFIIGFGATACLDGEKRNAEWHLYTEFGGDECEGTFERPPGPVPAIQYLPALESPFFAANPIRARNGPVYGGLLHGAFTMQERLRPKEE